MKAHFAIFKHLLVLSSVVIWGSLPLTAAAEQNGQHLPFCGEPEFSDKNLSEIKKTITSSVIHGDSIDFELNKIIISKMKNSSNKDGLIAYFSTGPYCGANSCMALILRQNTKSPHFKLIGTINQVSSPIYGFKNKNYGWQDLGILTTTGQAQKGLVRIRFNGSKYPSNPTMIKREIVNPDIYKDQILISDSPEKLHGCYLK
ncbi:MULTISPECIES: hypothetical protein [Acetobacter]|uniref:hypothetical protein n=1 Tax=Acetobacter TaxID=434 RepID=UPI00111CA522|nr:MULTISPECIES: hypothetical protein [Acetobacter]